MAEILEENSIQYALRHRDYFKNKSNKNKRISNKLLIIIILSSVLTPVFILVSADFWISKLLPSVLGAAAAFSSYWIQLKKPQEKWILFRSAQRQIEYEIDIYKFNLSNLSQKDLEKSLAMKVSQINLEAHQNWIPLLKWRSS